MLPVIATSTRKLDEEYWERQQLADQIFTGEVSTAPSFVYKSTPPDIPLFYFHVGGIVHAIVKEFELSAKSSMMRSKIEHALRCEYPQANVVEGGDAGKWKFFLVENEGRHTVVFHGTVDLGSEQGDDGLSHILHRHLSAMDSLAVVADQFNFHNPVGFRALHDENYKHVDKIGETIRRWESKNSICVDALFGYSAGGLFANEVKTTNPCIFRISLNSALIHPKNGSDPMSCYRVDFYVEGDGLTRLFGTQKHAMMIPARLVPELKGSTGPVKSHCIEGVHKAFIGTTWQDFGFPPSNPQDSDISPYHFIQGQNDSTLAVMTQPTVAGANEMRRVSRPHTNRDFPIGAGCPRETPKPKGIDWDNFQRHICSTPAGNMQFGVVVPVNMRGYGTNAGVHVEIDPKIIADVYKFFVGRNIDENKKTVKTSHGNYKITLYKMDHDMFAASHSADYKVVIKDPRGGKHTIWATGAASLKTEIPSYLSGIIEKRVVDELGRFRHEFNSEIVNYNVQAAQKKLDVFYNTYRESLPPDFKQPYQLTVNERAAQARVKELQDAPISSIISFISNTNYSGILSRAQYIEQQSLKQLLVEKLLSCGTKKDFEDCKPLLEKGQGKYIGVPELKIVEFAPVEDFKRHKNHYRTEMRDRAQASFNRVLTAFGKVANAARAKQGVEDAYADFQRIFKKEKEGKYEGFGIRMNEGHNAGWLFEIKYPEVVECYKGNSQWLHDYRAMKEQEIIPFISEGELRQIQILKNLQDYNLADGVLSNEEALSEKRQEAFQKRYEAAQCLQEADLQPGDLGDESVDTKFITSVIEHYDWCEGSYACSRAVKSIADVVKPYVEIKDGNTIIRIHEMQDKEMLAMRTEAEALSKIAKTGGKLYLYSQDIICKNYKALSDSWGKFISLGVAGIFSDYTQRLEKGSWKRTIAQGLVDFNTIFPGVLQDMSILPRAFLEGNRWAGLNNIIIGGVESLKNYKNDLVSFNLRTVDMTVKIAGVILPYFYPQQDKKNRTLYQALSLTNNALAARQALQSGTMMVSYAPTTPFSIFEFFASDSAHSDPLPKISDFIQNVSKYYPRLASVVLTPFARNIVRQASSVLTRFTPYRMPGNLPENSFYYAVKDLLATASTAMSTVMAGRQITGPHGGDRDIKAATAFTFALPFIRGYMGKFDEYGCHAMVSNACFNMKQLKYGQALLSIIRLEDNLRRNFQYRGKELQFIQLKEFAVENRVKCLFNIALNLYEENSFEEALPFIKILKAALDHDIPLVKATPLEDRNQEALETLERFQKLEKRVGNFISQVYAIAWSKCKEEIIKCGINTSEDMFSRLFFRLSPLTAFIHVYDKVDELDALSWSVLSDIVWACGNGAGQNMMPNINYIVHECYQKIKSLDLPTFDSISRALDRGRKMPENWVRPPKEERSVLKSLEILSKKMRKDPELTLEELIAQNIHPQVYLIGAEGSMIAKTQTQLAWNLYPIVLDRSEKKSINYEHVLSIVRGKAEIPSAAAGFKKHERFSTVRRIDDVFLAALEKYSKDLEAAIKEDLENIEIKDRELEQLKDNKPYTPILSIAGLAVGGAAIVSGVGFVAGVVGLVAGGGLGFYAGRASDNLKEENNKKHETGIRREQSYARRRWLVEVDKEEKQRLSEMENSLTERMKILTTSSYDEAIGRELSQLARVHQMMFSGRN